MIEGAELAAARRCGRSCRLFGRPCRRGCRPPRRRREIDLARGPARLCQALAIDRALDGADVCDPASPLQVLAPAGTTPSGLVPQAAPGRAWPGVLDWHAAADGAVAPPDRPSAAAPRVGVSRAAEIAWRFWVTGERAVSPYRASVPRRARAETGLRGGR